MKKFRFPLQNVLRLRHHQTEAARERLEAAAAAVRAQEAVVEAARQERDRVASGTAGAGPVRPDALRHRHAFRAAAQRTYEDARRRLSELRTAEAEARTDLVRRSQDEEALQTLHDNARDAYAEAEAAADVQFLDEQAVTSFHRRSA